jgi:hypothetical protein
MYAAPDQAIHQQAEVHMWAFIFQTGPRRSFETSEPTDIEDRNATAGAPLSGPAESNCLASRADAWSGPIFRARPMLLRSRQSRSDGVLGLRWLA